MADDPETGLGRRLEDRDLLTEDLGVGRLDLRAVGAEVDSIGQLGAQIATRWRRRGACFRDVERDAPAQRHR